MKFLNCVFGIVKFVNMFCLSPSHSVPCKESLRDDLQCTQKMEPTEESRNLKYVPMDMEHHLPNHQLGGAHTNPTSSSEKGIIYL